MSGYASAGDVAVVEIGVVRGVVTVVVVIVVGTVIVV